MYPHGTRVHRQHDRVQAMRLHARLLVLVLFFLLSFLRAVRTVLGVVHVLRKPA